MREEMISVERHIREMMIKLGNEGKWNLKSKLIDDLKI